MNSTDNTRPMNSDEQRADRWERLRRRDYIELTRRMYSGDETLADLERREALVQGWSLEEIDRLDDIARAEASR